MFSHLDDTGDTFASTAIDSSPSNIADLPGFTDVPANYKLIAFITHKGPSVHSGHYVAHIRKGAEGEWIFFNDEKVVKADENSVDDLKKLAYLYFFVRVS